MEDFKESIKEFSSFLNLRGLVEKENIQNKDGYKVGDVLYAISGYDCTIIDFYKVVLTSEKMIWIVPINSLKIYELKKLNAELRLISQKIKKQLEKKGLGPVLTFSNYKELMFICGKHNPKLSKVLIYSNDFFVFHLSIDGVESPSINLAFIYEKINRCFKYISEVIVAISDKLKKTKKFEHAVVNFNSSFKFEIETRKTIIETWHKIKINGIDFNIECEDDTLEFLVDLLNKEYIEK